jgi:hypothetical protein
VRRLIRRRLLVPLTTPTELPLGRHRLERKLDVQVLAIADGERRLLPAFTTESAFLAWRPEGTPFVAMDAEVVARTALDAGFDGVVIDVASAKPALLDRARLERIAD